MGDPRGQGGLKGEQTPKPAENLEGSQRGLGGGIPGTQSDHGGDPSAPGTPQSPPRPHKELRDSITIP